MKTWSKTITAPVDRHLSTPFGRLVAACVLLCITATGNVFAQPSGPFGYSINSDSDTNNADSLYLIDLANGSETLKGKVISAGQSRIDVEGLALAPDGTLYGVDDSSLTLFPINKSNGSVVAAEEVFINGLPSGGGNDFGMTFACDGNLYVSSVATNTLYVMGLDGVASAVGAQGGLGADISSLAAFGNPVQLYGLGNGVAAGESAAAATLYSIDPETGIAAEVGTLGAAAFEYHEAGLAFDDSGVLWAITDRRAVAGGPFGSQILRINKVSGLATAVSTTAEVGFESLAITYPRGCDVTGEELANFAVHKRFLDFNDVDGATFTLSCNTGLPIEQTRTVQPITGFYEDFELEFVVHSFDSGTLNCDLSEINPKGYIPTYLCDGDSDCDAGESSPLDEYSEGPCHFSNVEMGDGNRCFIRNHVEPVEVEVTKIWVDEVDDFEGPTNADVQWTCANARESGNDATLGSVSGVLRFWKSEQEETFSVYPNFDPENPTVCSASEQFPGADSYIVSDDSDCDGLELSLGTDEECTIINTRVFAGIPTLAINGKLLLIVLVLGIGLIVIRRY